MEEPGLRGPTPRDPTVSHASDYTLGVRISSNNAILEARSLGANQIGQTCILPVDQFHRISRTEAHTVLVSTIVTVLTRFDNKVYAYVENNCERREPHH